jgi:hypothetical protein
MTNTLSREEKNKQKKGEEERNGKSALESLKTNKCNMGYLVRERNRRERKVSNETAI